MKKVLKNILLFIIAFLLCTVIILLSIHIRNNIVKSEFESFMSELKRNGNYTFSYRLLNGEVEETYEEISKDGAFKYKKRIGKSIDEVGYDNGYESIKLNNVDNTIICAKSMEKSKQLLSVPSDTIMDYFLGNSSEIKILSCTVDKFNNTKCYVLNMGIEVNLMGLTPVIGREEVYIDYKTHEIIGMRKDDELYTCKFEVNTVKNSDLEIKEDLSQYTEIKDKIKN